jgi:hypothetical protein
MEYKIINTGDYLLIVDDSEIKNYYYDFFISKLKHSNGAEYAKSDVAKQVIAHLPLNNSPILEGVDLLPPLEDDSNKLAYKYAVDYRCPSTNDNEYCKHDIISAYNNGYNKAKEKYKYTEEDLRKAIEVGVNAEAGDYPKGFSHKLGISLEDYFIQSLQQPKLPVGFNCEIVTLKLNPNQWVGEYIY